MLLKQVLASNLGPILISFVWTILTWIPKPTASIAGLESIIIPLLSLVLLKQALVWISLIYRLASPLSSLRAQISQLSLFLLLPAAVASTRDSLGFITSLLLTLGPTYPPLRITVLYEFTNFHWIANFITFSKNSSFHGNLQNMKKTLSSWDWPKLWECQKNDWWAYDELKWPLVQNFRQDLWGCKKFWIHHWVTTKIGVLRLNPKLDPTHCYRSSLGPASCTHWLTHYVR